MKFSTSIILFVSTLSSAGAYTIKPQNTAGRREMLQQVGAGALGLIAIANPANALDACPKGSNNCLTEKWTAPSGTITVNAINVEYLQQVPRFLFWARNWYSLFSHLTYYILILFFVSERCRYRCKCFFEKGYRKLPPRRPKQGRFGRMDRCGGWICSRKGRQYWVQVWYWEFRKVFQRRKTIRWRFEACDRCRRRSRCTIVVPNWRLGFGSQPKTTSVYCRFVAKGRLGRPRSKILRDCNKYGGT